MYYILIRNLLKVLLIHALILIFYTQKRNINMILIMYNHGNKKITHFSLFKRTPEKNYKQKSFPDTQISEPVVVVV